MTLQQTWPVREPLAQRLLAAGRIERLLPTEPLITGIRCIDTLFPIALEVAAPAFPDCLAPAKPCCRT